MIRAIFIIMVTCVILATAGFLMKDKLGFEALENFNIDKITGAMTSDKDKDKPKDEQESPFEKFKTLLTFDKKQDEPNDPDIYIPKVEENKPVKTVENAQIKPVKTDSQIFKETMENLFSGPTKSQKIAGVYSEIPASTKLLGIKEDKNSYTINISDDFEYGGGADSMKIRVKQLVTTATQAAKGKDVYLEINGKRVEFVGGEGIVILQPLQRNL